MTLKITHTNAPTNQVHSPANNLTTAAGVIAIGMIIGLGIQYRGLFSEKLSNRMVDRALTNWTQENIRIFERDERVLVAEEIQKCHKEKGTKLSLSDVLTLISLPETVLSLLTSLTALEITKFSGLSSITIPNTLTALEVLDLSHNTSLVSITIPDLPSLKTLNLSQCRSLRFITIPKTLTSLYLEDCPNFPFQGLEIGSGVIKDIPEKELTRLGVTLLKKLQ